MLIVELGFGKTSLLIWRTYACVGVNFLAWFPKEEKAYITLLPVSVPVTHFNSLSNVSQAGQMGGDRSGPKIVYRSL